MSWFLVLVRAVHFAAVLWLFGEFVFFSLVLGPALRTLSSNASVAGRESARRLLRVAGWCVATAILSAIAWLLLEAASMSGMPLTVAFNGQTLKTVLGETLFGRIWLGRLMISIALAAVLIAAPRRLRLQGQRLQFAGTALSGAYAATLAWTGHASADAGADRYIHLAADVLHLLAAGAWIGALPGLIFLLRRAGRAERTDSLALSTAAARRFSTLGLFIVSVLAATGVVNAAYLVGSVSALIGTMYGRLLLCKLLLFAGMLALAALNRLRATPRLARVAATRIGARAHDAQDLALGQLRRNVALELAAGIAIVAIVALLGITMPAAHMQHHERMPAMADGAGH